MSDTQRAQLLTDSTLKITSAFVPNILFCINHKADLKIKEHAFFCVMGSTFEVPIIRPKFGKINAEAV